MTMNHLVFGVIIDHEGDNLGVCLVTGGNIVANWISGAINPKNKGSLHRELGVPVGDKIPASKLAAAAKKGGKEGKRARLAETLKSFKK